MLKACLFGCAFFCALCSLPLRGHPRCRLRGVGVAPVRGGTYFLCRRKESKQRKRAHPASPCSYPRAPNVPILHAATPYMSSAASAISEPLTRFTHLYVGCPWRTFTAHLRQTVCRLSRRMRRRTEFFLATTLRFALRKQTRSLPQMGARLEDSKRWQRRRIGTSRCAIREL